MSSVGEREIRAQRRVIAFLRDALGYAYLGHWKQREGNAPIEEGLLTDWLKWRGYGDKLISRTLFELDKAATVSGSRMLYDANRDVYGFLRYGVKVKPEVGEQTETVWLIDWNEPENNHFAVAEEVTVDGDHTKRPDVVLYVNGIALGVLELKRSTVAVGEGIRQSLDNQKKEFIRPFFTTVQLVMAGNDDRGPALRRHRHAGEVLAALEGGRADPIAGDNPLDRASWASSAARSGCSRSSTTSWSSTPAPRRPAVTTSTSASGRAGARAARARAASSGTPRARGKSLTWSGSPSGSASTSADARVLIITDRTELDEQIEKVFKGVNEEIYRTKSGADLVARLNASEEWLICSLVHKFGGLESEGDVDDASSRTFTATCRRASAPRATSSSSWTSAHRTQSGKLHDAMKALLPGAMFIGFTGTPLLKSDKRTSIETFGPYIHTYKFDEAVRDGVVLDLRYEARDIDQSSPRRRRSTSGSRLKTKGLTDVARAAAQAALGHDAEGALSSRDRLEKIVDDILMDMETRDRLKSGHGNAHARLEQHLLGVPVLRDVPADRPRRASAPSSPPTGRSPPTSRARRRAKG